ncbi:acyl carrier protein [Streptomyces zhihengii]
MAGVRLPATLVFDHPTPVEAARRILTEVGGAATGPRPRRSTRNSSGSKHS